MEDKSQDVMVRAYSTLLALRKNIEPMNYNVEEVYVQEFHSVLDRLRDVGLEVAEFRIPESLIKPRVTASWSDAQGTHHSYSDERYIAQPYILTKIDAILSYFEIITSEKPREIGFKKHSGG